MRPIWDKRREEIEQFLAEGKSSTEIAAHYGTTMALIQKNCSRWGLSIPRRKSLLEKKNGPWQDNPQADPFARAYRK